MIKNVDPNIQFAKKTFEVVLMQWDYTKTFVVKVSGNCHGFDNFDVAIYQVYDQLETNADGVAHLVMENKAGDTCIFEDEEDKGEDFLREMVVSIRLLAIEPE